MEYIQNQDTGLDMNTILIEPDYPQPVVGTATHTVHTGTKPDFQGDAAGTEVPTLSAFRTNCTP